MHVRQPRSRSSVSMAPPIRATSWSSWIQKPAPARSRITVSAPSATRRGRRRVRALRSTRCSRVSRKAARPPAAASRKRPSSSRATSRAPWKRSRSRSRNCRPTRSARAWFSARWVVSRRAMCSWPSRPAHRSSRSTFAPTSRRVTLPSAKASRSATTRSSTT